MASPSAKARLKKPEAAGKPKPKPGSSTKRTVPIRSVKTLDKVLSKETEKHRRSMSRGPSGIIALLRSTSTSMLKREASEPLSITSIPKGETTETNEKTSANLASGSIKLRLEEEKAKKEAIVKAELRDAINTLRRPNRDVVGKAMTEAAERRATTSLSQLRSESCPVVIHIPNTKGNLQNRRSPCSIREPRALSKRRQ